MWHISAGAVIDSSVLFTAIAQPAPPAKVAGGFDRAGALQAVAKGGVDAVAFGGHFISNPDLPRRLELGAPLTHHHRPSFDGGGAAGCTDDPMLEQLAS